MGALKMGKISQRQFVLVWSLSWAVATACRYLSDHSLDGISDMCSSFITTLVIIVLIYYFKERREKKKESSDELESK